MKLVKDTNISVSIRGEKAGEPGVWYREWAPADTFSLPHRRFQRLEP